MASSSVTTPLLADVAPPQQSPRAQHHADLNPAPKKRLLNFWDGVSLTLGIQIGSGIFISPALVARNTSSELPALAVWTAGGLLAWACASCYIEMGTRLPVNGGPQEYLAHCFGDLLGFMASWGCIFGIKPCSAAILALFIADYVCDVAGVGYRSLVALGVVALVTVVNCTGNRLSNVSTKILLACKTIGVGFVIVMGFAVLIFPDLLPPPADVPREPPPANGDAGNYTDALVAAMWAYSGWEVLSFVGGDLQNPSRNVPRVINVSMVVVLAFTLFANVAYFSALSFDEVARSTTVGLTFSQRFLGRAGSIVYAVAICLSSLGTLNVKTFAAGRLTQAAAERGYLPLLMKTVASGSNQDAQIDGDSLPEVQPAQSIFSFLSRPVRFGDGSIPLSAILFNSLLASAFVLAGDISALISLMGIVEYAVVFLTLIGLLHLRLRRKAATEDDDPERPIIKVPFILIPVALATVTWMVVVSSIRHWHAGVVFILCCAGIAGLHTLVIRPRR